MRIANPIYDCVFKFLMQDKASAKILISAITEFEVEDIELRPTEVQVKTGSIRDLTVYRLDLAAKVKTDEGSKLVTIEIQKALTSGDIMRFRRYLGSQYSSEENCEIVPTHMVSEKREPYETKRAIPIFTIYIIGYSLKTYPDIPVIKVKRNYYDNATKEILHKKDDFIESLTHDSAVIQVSALAGRRRDRLENVLSVFDQTLVTKDTFHTLLYSEHASMPKEVQKLIRPLQTAFATDKIRQEMAVQDEIINELANKQRHISELADSLTTSQQETQTERKLREEAEQRAIAAEQKATIERQLREEAERRISANEEMLKTILAELKDLKRQQS
jgi:hypothetical protein